MFRNPTVFVLGAGASWHYGYPTGEELVRKILKRALWLAAYCRDSREDQNYTMPAALVIKATDRMIHNFNSDWITGEESFTALKERLQAADPLVIDYFLGQNAPLQNVGKLLIAWVIAECQTQYQAHKINLNRKSEDNRRGVSDNWIRMVLQKLTSDCRTPEDLLNNDVKFVTFNYDLSLLDGLRAGLEALEFFRVSGVIDKFLADDRIIHVYGNIRGDGSQTFSPHEFSLFDPTKANVRSSQPKELHERAALFDKMHKISLGINVIEPDHKEFLGDSISKAKAAVLRATCIYVLGFGFDLNNCSRIGISKSLANDSTHRRAVLFTNYQDSNRVNKAVSKIFFDDVRTFLGNNVYGYPTYGFYCEKSVRDTYEALSLDFDDLENQPLASASA